MKILLIIALLVLPGCAASNRIIEANESYISSRTGNGFWDTTAKLTAEAVEKAELYCFKQSTKKAKIIRVDERAAGIAVFPESKVYFVCEDLK